MKILFERHILLFLLNENSRCVLKHAMLITSHGKRCSCLWELGPHYFLLAVFLREVKLLQYLRICGAYWCQYREHPSNSFDCHWNNDFHIRFVHMDSWLSCRFISLITFWITLFNGLNGTDTTHYDTDIFKYVPPPMFISLLIVSSRPKPENQGSSFPLPTICHYGL